MSSKNNNLVRRRDLLGMLAAISCAGSAKATGASTVDADDRRGGTRLRTIGVLGGLGPQATMDFEARVHKVAQGLIQQRENSGYPPMIVYYHRHPPIAVNQDLSPRFPIQPDTRLLEAARRLGSWADFLVLTSNGAHLIQEQLEQASGRKVLSMIEVTLDEIRRRGWRRVGVLGFGNPTVYTTPLASMKVAYETLEAELRGALDTEIMKVMEGRDDATSVEIARVAVNALRTRHVDGIVLGCTEIPLLLREDAATSDLVVNPAQLLADAAVKRALA